MIEPSLDLHFRDSVEGVPEEGPFTRPATRSIFVLEDIFQSYVQYLIENFTSEVDPSNFAAALRIRNVNNFLY
jgi:hypothetical protein